MINKNIAWRLALPMLMAAALLALPVSCMFGQYAIPPHKVLAFLSHIAGWSAPSGDDAEIIATVLGRIRMARGCCALICGGALALAGAILQGALRNPLADPFTLGISAGAACGASLAIASGVSLAAAGLSHAALVACAALLGALLALALALLLGRGRGSLQRESVILAGVAVASFLGAIVALIKALNEESVTSIVFWIMGSLQGAGWHSLPMLALTMAPGLAAALIGWRSLDVLSLGDEEAASLGLRAAICRFWLLLGASSMTAGCVAIVGIIGFVGLVVPHILRMLMGGAHGPLLLASFPAGGIFLLLADCLARSILPDGQELPAGVVTALMGAPFFAFLIWQKQRP